MPYEFKMTRLVEFAETDMAGIMHFANYFRYMEVVEHAFFRSLGLSVHQSSTPAAGDADLATAAAADAPAADAADLTTNADAAS